MLRWMRLSVAVAVLALAACDTATSLDEVTMEGIWDAVGPVSTAAPGLKLRLQPEVDGAFSGTWQTETHSGVLQGQRVSVEEVTFTLFAFPPSGNRSFSGQLATILRMTGTIDLGQSGGEAVFLRSSFSP